MNNQIIEGFRLSPQQERLWLLQQGGTARTPFRAVCAVLIEGDLRAERLEAALRAVVARHEILRTTFQLLPAMTLPVQVIAETSGVELGVRDLSGLGPERRGREVEALLAECAARPFDFAEGPLLDATLAALAADRHVLVLGLPALCADAAALDNLLAEIVGAYGGGDETPDAPMQYADVAEILNELVESDSTKAGREFWQKKSLPPTDSLKLACELQPQDGAAFDPRRFKTALDAETAARVGQLASRFRTTAGVVLLACWQTLLYRLSGQAEVVTGTLYDCRAYEELGGSLGLFAKHLPVHASLSGDATFVEVLRRVAQAAHEVHDRQEYFTWGQVAAGGSADFFPYAFEYAESPAAETRHGLTFSVLERHVCVERFKLNLSVVRGGDALGATLYYDASRFRLEDVRRVEGHFLRLLESALDDPEERVGRLEILGEEERRLLVEVWNDTAADFAPAACVHRLVEEQAARTPEAVAVVFEGRQLTYAELDRGANRLANHLRALGVGPETRVGVCVERSAEMVVALLAVLKAGGAYVPLDPEYPQERLAFMLEDARVRVLVTERPLADALPEHGARVVLLDADAETIARAGAEGPEGVGVEAQNLAYVIYTSGSTGKPKGVMISHRAIANRLLWMQRAFPLTGVDAVLQKTAFSFDASVWELFVPLLAGARLVVARPGGQQDSAYLVGLMREQRVTVLQLVPSMLRVVLEEAALEDCEGLRHVYCGGEALPTELERRFRARVGAALHNLYGPTEASIDVTHELCDGESQSGVVPIGRPLANVRLYILDEQFRPVPVGVAGQLHAGGVQLARGYLDRPGLTAERFIPDPFSAEPGARIYRTGDSARYMADGRVEFLGRIDHQVKLRGFRIELGEVESALAEHPAVREAVALVREDEPGDKRLVAYVAHAPGQTASPLELRGRLRERLPEYMVPSAVVALEQLPRAPNGKLDRGALPAPEAASAGGGEGYAPPRGATEEILAGMWEHLLKTAPVGRDDNFFDLGGHSLLATRVISWVREVFRVEVPLRALFESPTVAGLSAVVEREVSALGGAGAATIERVSRERELPLSFAQQRLWFLDQLEPGNVVYHLVNAARLKGRLNVAALEKSLGEVVRRHESLRTTFRLSDRRPVQVIHPALEVKLAALDLRHLEGGAQEAEVGRALADAVGRPFDLAEGPLLRAELFRLGEEEHVLAVVMHHIISDGWSMGVLVREAASLYEQFDGGGAAMLAELPVQYADYAAWQREHLRGAELEAQLEYWRGRLADAPALLELPTDRPRPAVQSFRGARLPLVLPRSLVEGLKALSRQQGATLFMTLVSAFQALLARYAGQTDVSVGTPIAGRNRFEVEGLIGYFANTLVLRTDLSGDPTFVELLARVREAALGAYAHQDLPFEKLVEELQPARDLSHNPLFQVLFSLQNLPGGDLSLSGLTWGGLSFKSSTARFDLSLDLAESPEGLVGDCEYNTDLFDAATVERLLGSYQTLLEGVVAGPERRLSDLPLLAGRELRLLLEEWNGSPSEVADDRCLHELFEAHAARRPEAVAVSCDGRGLTFGELNGRANRLAHHLRRLGVGAETLVGVYVERSAEMLVGLLGILKAGGAYVPLDLAYPKDRLAFMLEDTGVRVLITAGPLLAGLPAAGAGPKVVRLDEDWGEIARESAENPPRSATQENLAYVIYTSGSTGRPKGVQVRHGSVVSLLEATRPTFGFGGRDVWTLFHSYAFDFSVWEIWGCLLNGGRLVVAPLGVTQSPEEFYDLLRREGVTVLNLTPSALRQLTAVRGGRAEADERLALRLIVCGGEALPKELAPQLSAWGVAVWNFYGPTEATVWATAQEVGDSGTGGGSTSIGRPLANSRVYILDERLRPVPVGVAGQLHVGGFGLARGYLNRPALTAEKFIPDPFSEEPGARLYRTGDAARHTADGRVEFVGRIDHQVKLRGFRIELGEIEAVLGQHPAVREAVVLVREDEPDDRRLVAYLVAVPQQQPPATSELRGRLRERLPEYMVPSSFVWLDELPLSTNGKLDRKALPPPDEAGRGRSKEGYEEPRGATEEIVAGMWQHLLKSGEVGRGDNFFELGGHSLLATQLISWVREAFKVEVPLRGLFESPTLSAFSRLVERLSHSPAHGDAMTMPITPAGREGALPLSYAQRRLWFLHQLDPASAVYHIPAALRLAGPLDAPALGGALREVVRRHESLRTTFREEGGEPVQVVSPHSRLDLPLSDLTALAEGERQEEAERLAGEEARRPFDLGAGPLLRAGLLRLGEEEHVLLVTMHHIVSDGWSLGVLVREAAGLYAAFREGLESPLEELRVQYADYAVWQREHLRGEVLERQLDYWRGQLAGAPASLALPSDEALEGKGAAGRGGGREPVEVSAEVSGRVRELSRSEGATPFMTLLAAFQALLSVYSGQTDILVGTVTAGRGRAEIEPLIGFFVNTLVLRTDLSGDPSFRELLARVREVALGAYAHQDVPFEKLVEAVQPARVKSRAPLFQVVFALQDTLDVKLELPGLVVKEASVGHDGLDLDLDLFLALSDRPEGLRGWLFYAAGMFEPRTARRIIAHYQTILSAVAARPDIRLGELAAALAEFDRREQTSRQKRRGEEKLKKFKSVRPVAVNLAQAATDDN
jgi:amino acid adenylation domain-containing protein